MHWEHYLPLHLGGEAVDVDAIADAAHQFAMPQCGECRRKKVPVVKGRKKKNAKAHAMSQA
jgi:hypothetical protein